MIFFMMFSFSQIELNALGAGTQSGGRQIASMGAGRKTGAYAGRTSAADSSGAATGASPLARGGEDGRQPASMQWTTVQIAGSAQQLCMDFASTTLLCSKKIRASSRIRTVRIAAYAASASSSTLASRIHFTSGSVSLKQAAICGSSSSGLFRFSLISVNTKKLFSLMNSMCSCSGS